MKRDRQKEKRAQVQNDRAASPAAVSEDRSKDEEYLKLFTDPLISCARYKPKFGKGGATGVDLEQFRRMYGEDPFYSWVGLDSPLMYAAHKAAGGMTSIYRQLGIGGERLFRKILQDTLGLSAEQAAWTYKVPVPGRKDRNLSLDGRIELDDVAQAEAKERVRIWVEEVAAILLPEDEARPLIKGVVFEVRQGYKSKDSKRQNADIGNASSAYANLYIPTLLILSTQIDSDVALRYQQARWLLLIGSVNGAKTESSYAFCREILGYDLASFFQRNSEQLKKKLEEVLKALLSA